MIFWLIQFLPLAAAAAVLLSFQRRRGIAAALSVGSAVLCTGLALYAVFKPLVPPHPAIWLEIGLFQVDFGFTFDNLAKLMLMVVTGVGALIHIFSIGYMSEDEDPGRYFGFLSIFMFSMTGIVFATNFIQLFVFWELVGLSSYLLIGFWYRRDPAAQAAKKAFLTNKVGDCGFMLGILCVWTLAGTLSFADLAALSKWTPVELETVTVTLTAAALLIFCGAVGKSAQFPLHVWLPDAMEGPTPVSALIHAATMVAAGVYMLSRVYILISASAAAMQVIAAIGGITAVMSALIAIQQNDIKRILAYSTLSQLGYMVMIIGIANVYSYAPAMFHLTTHAFFKALLFLGAGSVIVSLHHEQDIWKMGGLAGKMKLTFFTFLIGALALAGFPGLSGFWSKELILNELYQNNRVLFGAGIFTAFLTAFYMTRLIVIAFFGLPRSESAMHARESSLVMTAPLVLLMLLSAFGGNIGVQKFLPATHPAASHAVLLISMLALAAGISLAGLLYWNQRSEPVTARILEPIRRKFYFDEIYDFLVRNIQGAFAALLNFIDRWVLDFGIFRGTAALVRGTGTSLRLLLTGNVQIYAFLFGAGAILLIWWELLR